MKYGELNLGQIEAIVNKLGGMDGVQRFLAGTSEVVVKGLLEQIGTAAIPSIAPFTAAEKFRIGETIDGITVGWLGDNFKEHFLQKIETGEVATETLAINKLQKRAKDPAIITALGGEEKVEISLGQFWEYLKTANRNLWHVAYIRDDKSVLWAVNALCYGGKLDVEAHSLGDPGGWYAGNQFLSR
jgi:hypothetical protein